MAETASLSVAVEQRLASGFDVAARLDAAMRPGSVLVLFGPSGAGKSTILRQIAGLERPDSGSIRFDGETWCDIQRQLWRPPQSRRIGVVFQEPTLFPHLTVRDNIRYGIRQASNRNRVDTGSTSDADRMNGGWTSDAHRVSGGLVSNTERVAEIEMMLGIGDLQNRYPRSLSGGESQRVALARALAPDPRLLLLDEPFASLDSPARARLRGELRALLRTTGTPAILVTHDRTEALALGDEVAVVIAGRVRQTGPVGDVFSRPVDAVVAASLGVETVVAAHVAGSADGVIEIAIGDRRLHAVEREPMPSDSAVYVCVRAEDVTLEVSEAGQASSRNHLAARVVSIVSEGPVDRVTLDCGFPLDALITRRSRDELHLGPGSPVIAAIKATAVHLVPRI